MPRAPKSRKWCFTLHSFHANHVLRLRRIQDWGAKYVVFGREICPSTGRRHLQGFIYLENRTTRQGVKKKLGSGFNGLHLEATKGTVQQNFDYCSKDGDFECMGERPAQGRRTDLLEIKNKIKNGVSMQDIADDYFTQWVVYRRSFQAYKKLMHKSGLRLELEVFLLIGAAGVGKTRFVYETWANDEGGLWIAHDPDLKWFDGYRGEQTVLIDDFRGGADFAFLLRLLDVYPLQVPVKGDFEPWRAERIILTSNTEPNEWYKHDDLAPLLRRIKKTARISAASNPTWESVRAFLSRTLGVNEG